MIVRWVGLVTALALAGGSVLPVQATERAAPVPTYVVELREVDLSYPAESLVEAVRQATVAAQVAGRITEVRVESGQRVRAGELMMRIDAREAAEGAAGAQAQLAQARATFERTRNLRTQNFISQAALDKAEADYKAAKAAAGQSGAGLSHASIAAPMAGIVAQRHAELGEMAAPGRPLVTVFDPAGLRVIASVPQYKFAEVKRAARASIEFPDSGRRVAATRIEVLPTLDARSHTVTVRVYLPADSEGIVPGMAARVHFAVGRAKKLTVPGAALVQRGEVSAVYVIDAQAAARLRQVRMGDVLADGSIEILAGLSAGERISLDPVQTGIRIKQGR